MAGGRKGAAPAQHLVDGAHVDAARGLDAVLLGHEPHDGHLGVELLGVRIVNHVRRIVPSSALHEHPVDVAPVFWFLGDLRNRVLVDDLEVKLKLVNGDDVLARIVLQRGRQEGLREKEPGNPERRRGAVRDPVLKEVDPGEQVDHPRAERLQRQESLLGPVLGHLVVVQTAAHLFQVFRHDHFAHKGLLNGDQLVFHNLKQLVVLEGFLGQDRVHGLIVVGRELFSDRVQLVERGHFALNADGDFCNNLFTGLAASRGGPGLDAENTFQNDSGLVLVGDDLGVCMETERLGLWVERQCLDVVDVVLFRALRDTLVDPRLG